MGCTARTILHAHYCNLSIHQPRSHRPNLGWPIFRALAKGGVSRKTRPLSSNHPYHAGQPKPPNPPVFALFTTHCFQHLSHSHPQHRMPHPPRDLCQRPQHKRSLMHRRMRQHQLRRIHHHIPHHQQIQINHPRPFCRNKCPIPPHRQLNPQQTPQQLHRRKLCLQQHSRIQKTRLFQIPHRLRVMKRRNSRNNAQRP